MSTDDVLFNNYSFFENLDNVMFVDSVSVDGVTCLGKIINSNNVYYCKSNDNYTSKINICDRADDAIFCQNSNGEIVFVYLIDGQLYLKSESGDSVVVDYKRAKSPSYIVSPQINKYGVNVFGLGYDDGSVDMWMLDGMQTYKILNIKGKNIRLIVRENIVYVISIFNYLLNVAKYTIDISQTMPNMLTCEFVYSKNNIYDCNIIDDKLFYCSNGICLTEEIID